MLKNITKVALIVCCFYFHFIFSFGVWLMVNNLFFLTNLLSVNIKLQIPISVYTDASSKKNTYLSYLNYHTYNIQLFLDIIPKIIYLMRYPQNNTLFESSNLDRAVINHHQQWRMVVLWRLFHNCNKKK